VQRPDSSDNESSIGIELVNRGDGKDPFTDKQLEALKALISTIAKKYKLQRAQVKTHAELDHGMETCGSIKYKRKQDPGAAFPLQSVLDGVFPK
jgi:N-acetyl-anhydromuramyl-L-alanine amidase AmpD